MPSLIKRYEYDIFISYRHNDNRSGWVTEFVNALQEELAATIKEPLSIYFDKNPHDGLLETHDVDDSLKEKLKCLIFIPIISQTYCDPKSFAWTSEFLVFLKMAAEDSIGLKVRLGNGNTSSRLLPIRIHELDATDKKTIETQIGPLRSIDFTYQSSGVNRPLRPKDDESIKGVQSVYRDQINKTANAIKEIIAGIQGKKEDVVVGEPPKKSAGNFPYKKTIQKRKWRFQLPGIKTILVLSLIIIALLAVALLYTNTNRSKNQEALSPIITSIILPDSIALHFLAGPLRVGRRGVDISPDGKTIVYVSMDSTGISQLNIRPLHEEKVVRLPGTKGAFSPFFSPDSKWIAFFSEDKLLKISIDGNVKETLTQTANPVDGIWTKEDRIIWTANESVSLNSIDADGQDKKVLKTTMRFASRPVQLSPDQYLATNSFDETYVISFTEDIGSPILRSGVCQALIGDELLLMKGIDLFAVHFDVTGRTMVGSPRLIAKGVSLDPNRNAQISVSSAGTLLYANGTHLQMGELVWRSRLGKLTALSFPPDLYGTFSLSSDGKNLAVIKRNEQSEVWNFNLTDARGSIQLTKTAIATGTIWQPSSNWVYYNVYLNGKVEFHKRDANGRSEAEVVLSGDSLRAFTDVNSKGEILHFSAESGGFNDIIVFYPNSDTKRNPFFSRKGVNETLSKFMPDNWIAFTSDQTGRSEVFLSDLLNPIVRIQVSFDGGEEPRYHTADKKLYYRNGNKLMVVDLVFDANRKPLLGSPEVAFEDNYWVNVPGYSYDLSPDGKQFLYVRAKGTRETREIKILQNFFDIQK